MHARSPRRQPRHRRREVAARNAASDRHCVTSRSSASGAMLRSLERALCSGRQGRDACRCRIVDTGRVAGANDTATTCSYGGRQAVALAAEAKEERCPPGSSRRASRRRSSRLRPQFLRRRDTPTAGPTRQPACTRGRFLERRRFRSGLTRPERLPARPRRSWTDVGTVRTTTRRSSGGCSAIEAALTVRCKESVSRPTIECHVHPSRTRL
jgi:hypothetical protein